ADDIRRVGLDGILVGAQYDRLRSEVQDDVRREFSQLRQQTVLVADIGASRLEHVADRGELVEARHRRRLERIAAHVRAETREPQREPAALEARVPGEEDAFVAPVIPAHRATACGIPAAHTPAALTSSTASMGSSPT